MDADNKLLRKVRRKRAQFRSLEPDMHVTFVEPDSLSGRTSPEKLFHFFIGNGGTRNGVSRELLRALLGKLHAVYMPEAKDFCFASVLGASRARDVFRRSGVCVQGSCKKRDLAHLVNPALMKGPPLHLYLSLVDCIPSVLLGDESSGRETDTHPHLPPGLLLVLEFVSQREEEELVQYLGSVGAGHGREGTQCSSKLCGWSSAGGSNGPSCEPDYRVKSKEMLDSDTASCSKVRHVLTPNSEQLQTHQVLTESSSTELRVVPNSPTQARPPIETALKHRRVRHYGYEFMYGSNRVNPDCPLPGGIPQICLPLLGRIVERGLLPWIPDQLTVNEYFPGAGIPSHIDTHSPFEGGIISISLLSSVVMDFKHPDGRKVPVYLPRRSLLIMTGESRYLWSHGIVSRKSDVVYSHMLASVHQSPRLPGPSHLPHPPGPSHLLHPPDHSPLPHVPIACSSSVVPRGSRISLTFRKVKRDSCTCAYPSHCDSQMGYSNLKSSCPSHK